MSVHEVLVMGRLRIGSLRADWCATEQGDAQLFQLQPLSWRAAWLSYICVG